MSLEDYNIIGKIGSGAFGKIYIVKYLKKSRYLVLKLIPVNKKKVIRAGLILSTNIKHKNLMRSYGYFQDTYKGKKYIVTVMEYLDGQTLDDLMEELGPRFLRVLLPNIIKGLVDGLRYLETKEIIHSDIKPENIILMKDDTVKIIDYDFMIPSDMNKYYGTPYFLSPEMVRGRKYGMATDRWSLGITIYYLLTFEYPFEADNKEELYDEILHKSVDLTIIPEDYRELISGLLTKNPKKRMTLDKISEIIKTLDDIKTDVSILERYVY